MQIAYFATDIVSQKKSAMKPKKWTIEESGPDPVQLLENLMKQRRLRAVDLAAQLGISKSLMSNILCYQRTLSKEVIRKLAARFEVDQECFNRSYNLLPQRKIDKPAGRSTGQPQAQSRFGISYGHTVWVPVMPISR
jgi:antitoxin component HigA of HigAB toxin-antitoxin module